MVGVPVSPARLRAATDLMRHRGPDEDGFYQSGPVALGMRRLKVIDLSSGTQPKENETGTVHVVLNGEIYNYRELRNELLSRDHLFTSDSDTEVVVHAYEEWGSEAFRRLNGIFAIAVWDSGNGTLVLARDHLGVKPMFYTRQPSQLVFGSELKPLAALLSAMPEIDPYSFAMFLRYQYVPAPRSIFCDVHKLAPAHYLTYDLARRSLDVRRYWNPVELARAKRRFTSVDEAEVMVESAIREAVCRQLVSDVPVGSFLSGGIDSSMVVSMMAEVSTHTPKTFSIGFVEESADESRFARRVAHHLGTEHHERIVTPAEALNVLPRLPEYFDEPFSDSSAIPTFLVSQLAREHVTVSLSGDGGDELFGGYGRYRRLLRYRRLYRTPHAARRVAARVARRVPGRIGTTFRLADSVFIARGLSDAYRNMVAPVGDTVLDAITGMGGEAYETNAEWPSELFEGNGLLEAMMLADLTTYLPDAILTKVDRASMAWSLEARVPLLDKDLVELLLSVPVDIRSAGEPKGLLKRILRKRVPGSLVDRPKKGFGIPIHSWLRNELYETVMDYTNSDVLRTHGLMDPVGVAALMREHKSGRANRGYALWAIFMFQMWYETFYSPAVQARARAS